MAFSKQDLVVCDTLTTLENKFRLQKQGAGGGGGKLPALLWCVKDLWHLWCQDYYKCNTPGSRTLF